VGNKKRSQYSVDIKPVGGFPKFTLCLHAGNICAKYPVYT
jgi:hypothetical protein